MWSYALLLLILACPLMMIFMMRGMRGRGGMRGGHDMGAEHHEPSQNKQPSQNDAGASQRIVDLERQAAELRAERDTSDRPAEATMSVAASAPPRPPAHTVGARLRSEIAARLHTAHGQLASVTSMNPDSRSRIEVLDQLSAVNAALDAVAVPVRTDHTNACVRAAIESGDSDEQVAVLVTGIRRRVRSR